MKRKFTSILSAVTLSLSLIISLPAPAFANTANGNDTANDYVCCDGHDVASCTHATEHDHELHESLLGEGISVAVLDSGITGYETAKSISFVDDVTYSEHGDLMAETLMGEVPGVELFDARVLDAEGKGKYSDIRDAIIWSVDNGADVIVMSFEGSVPSTILETAIDYASEKDVVMIAAAGNGSDDKAVYPAAYPAVISAGSVTESGELSPISNYGEFVDMYVNAGEGTSYAAQYVAAEAVKYMQQNPDADSAQVRAALTNNNVKKEVSDSSSENAYVYAAACSHSYTVTVGTKRAATCTSKGIAIKKCSKCTSTTEVNTPALGHNYTVTVRTKKAATCTTSGIVVKKCSRCTATTEVKTYALGHSYTTKNVSATCTTQGYTLKSCSRSGCSYSLKSNYVSALGHNYSATVGTKRAATCTAKGIAIKKCSRCTSTTEVNTAVLGHLLTSSKVSATCTTQGYTHVTCSRSGCSYSAKNTYVSALGHNYSATVGTKRAATCTEKGIAIKKCSRCTSTTEVNTSPLGHLLTTSTVKPTCTAQGYTHTTCKRSGCSYSAKSNYVSTIAHSYTVTLGTKRAATCTAAGIAIKGCSGCSATTEVNTSALGHSLSTSKVSPTCTTQGYTLTSCSRSGCTYAVKSDYVKEYGHNYTTKVGTKRAATCASTGIDIKKCTRCTSTTEATSPALGHLLTTTDVPPTCTMEGYMHTYCQRSGCSYSAKSVYADKLGHNYSINGGTKREANCATPGIEIVKCSRCTSITEVNTPKLGHIYTTEVVAPTCKESGYDLTTCKRDGCNYSLKVEKEKLSHDWGFPEYDYTQNKRIVTCESCDTELTWDEFMKDNGGDWNSLSEYDQKRVKRDYLMAMGLTYSQVDRLCEMSEESDIINIDNVDKFKTCLKVLKAASKIKKFQYTEELSSFLGFAAIAADTKVFLDNASPDSLSMDTAAASVVNLSATLLGYIPVLGTSYSKLLSELEAPIRDIINKANAYNAEIYTYDMIYVGLRNDLNITGYQDLFDETNYAACVEAEGADKVDLVIYYGLVGELQAATGKTFNDVLKMMED